MVSQYIIHLVVRTLPVLQRCEIHPQSNDCEMYRQGQHRGTEVVSTTNLVVAPTFTCACAGSSQ